MGDVSTTFLGLGNPGNSDVAQEVKDATSPAIAPDTGEETQGAPAKDATAGGAAEAGDKDIDGLNDEQFEKIVARLMSDPKSPYNKNKAWQRILSQRDGYSKRSESLLQRLAATNPDAARELMLDEGMSEEEVTSSLGNIEPVEQAKAAAPKADGVDDIEFMNLMKGMNISYDDLTPEQKQFWKFNFQFNRQMMQPVQKFIQNAETEKQAQAKQKIRADMEKEVVELQKSCKEKYGLDWENEAEPELAKYLKEHPDFIGTPKQLFSIVFFDKGEELGKKAKAVEDAKLTEEKKRIKSEEPASHGANSSTPAGVGKNFAKTWDWVNRER